MIKKLTIKYKTFIKQNVHLEELYLGTANSFILRLVGYGFTYLFTFFIAKIWGAGVTGIFILAILIINGLTYISTLGLENSILVLTSKYYHEKKTDLLNEILIKSAIFTIFVAIIISLLLYFSSGLISSNIFHKISLTEPLKYLALCILPISLLKLIAQFFRGIQKIKGYVFFNNVISYMLSLIFIIVFYFYDKSELIIYIAFTFSCYLSLLFGIYYIIKSTSVPLKIKNFINVKFQTLFDISIPLSLSNLINYLSLWSGVFIAGMFLSKSLVGVYGISVKMVSIFAVIIFSVKSISMPKIGTLYHLEDKQSLNEILFNTSRITTFAGIPAIILAIIISKPIFNFLGDTFSSSYIPFVILCIGQLFQIVFSPSDFILQMVGKHKVYFLILSFCTIIQIILSVGLILLYDVTGAAIAASVSSIIQTGLLVFYLRKKLNININYVRRFVSILKPGLL